MVTWARIGWVGALAVACVACGDAAPVFSPVIDVPVNETASAFPLDSITVSVARAGDALDLVSATFSRGEPIELPSIPYGDDLVMHMTGRVGASEVAYGRTCRFELRADGRLPAPRLWFSRLVKFGGMTVRPIPRAGGFAFTYDDGSGLLLGGVNPGDPADSIEQVERYDPSTGQYETLRELAPRDGAVSAALGDVDDTRIAVIGGIDPSTGGGAEFVEVLDADASTERQYDTFFEPQMARVGLTATTLSDGRVIVIGGRSAEGPASGLTTEVAISGGIVNVRQLRAQLAVARHGHTATRLADQVGAGVLVAGGLDDSGQPVARAELFKPLSEGFSATFDRAMVIPRSRHVAVPLPDGSVLILGGVDGSGAPVPTIELFTLDAGFVALDDLPPTAGLLDFSATVLPDGRVLLAGGRRAPGDVALGNAFIARLDPLDGTIDIVATDRLGEPRAGHQATLLCDGTVLLAGGTTSQSTYERYNPPAEGRR